MAGRESPRGRRVHGRSRRTTRRTTRWLATFVAAIVLCAGVTVSAASLSGGAQRVHGPGAQFVANSTMKPIALYGDSLAGQSARYFSRFVKRSLGATPLISTLDGTAPCDALPGLLTAAKSRVLSVAVIDFSGNALTPCMTGAPVGTPAYFARYHIDIWVATMALVSSGTNVVLAGSPETFKQAQQGGTSWEWLNQMLASVADADPAHVRFVDAGASVMSNGQFTWSLPCLRGEPCLNQPERGSNFVRAPDGAHFCPYGLPATKGVVGPCAEYMSGAFRYGSAMAAAALQMMPRR